MGEGGCRKIEHDDDDDDVDDDDDAISLNTWLPFKNLSAFFFFTKPATFQYTFIMFTLCTVFLSMNFKVYNNYSNSFVLFLIRIRNIKWQWFTSVNNFSLSIIKLRIQACSFIYTWIYLRRGRSCLAISQRRYRQFVLYMAAIQNLFSPSFMNECLPKKLYRRCSYSYIRHTHKRLNFHFFIHDFSFLLQYSGFYRLID